MLNRLPWESAQIQCTHFYFRFWTEGKTNLWNSWWQKSIWLRTSFKIQKREVFMRLWERGRLRDASKDFLRKKGKTTFYGTGWAMVGNSCHLKQGSAWRMLRQAPKWGLIPVSPTRMGSKGDAQPEDEALWGINGKYRAMTEKSALPSITSTDVASENCPCCRRSRPLMKCRANSVKS